MRDYGSAKNLEALVANFVSSALDPAVYQLYDSTKTSLSGNSNDKVYFVKDAQGMLRYIVKAFTKPDLPVGKFLHELSGIALLRKLCLPHVEPIRPIAVGKGLAARSAMSFFWKALLQVNAAICLFLPVNGTTGIALKDCRSLRACFPTLGQDFKSCIMPKMGIA